MATKNIVPRSNGEGKLGTNVKQWLEVQAQKVYAGLIDVGETLKNLMDTKAPKDNPTFTGTVSGIKASMIENVSTGTISSVTVQDAITELDTKKATKSNTLSGYGITDGVTQTALSTALASYASISGNKAITITGTGWNGTGSPAIYLKNYTAATGKNVVINSMDSGGLAIGDLSTGLTWFYVKPDLTGYLGNKQIAITDSPTFIHQANIINSTTAQISIAGGGGVPGTNSFDIQQDGGACYLWNRSSTPILFGTGGTQRMCIGADGNVGVNISNSLQTLAVKGTFNVMSSAGNSNFAVLDDNCAYVSNRLAVGLTSTPQAFLHVGGPSIFNRAGASSSVLANNELTMCADNSFLYFTWKDPSGNLRTVQFIAPAAGATRTI